MSTSKCFSCNDYKSNVMDIQDFDPAFQEIIEKIINKEGYINCTVVKRNFNTGGGNFLGELAEVDVKGETAEGTKEINIFTKKRITLEKIKMASAADLYFKEALFYNDISKVFTYLQDQANVPEKDKYKSAKFYDESTEDILMFENLAVNGFKTYERFFIPLLKYVELAIQELAKFHGLSFVVEQKMPEYHAMKLKTLKHSLNYDDDWKGLMRNVFSYIAKLFDKGTRKKIENFLPIALKKFPRYHHDQSSIRCCLCHGDYRVNNILVREINGVPAEVITIDFQLMDYGCPLRDFLYLIYTCTDRHFRVEHLNNLKELYFETMRKFLQYFEIDIEVVYPREEFERVYREWLDFGLINAMYASPFLYAPETGLDVVNLSLSELPFNPVKEFEERVHGWVEDFIEWGYL